MTGKGIDGNMDKFYHIERHLREGGEVYGQWVQLEGGHRKDEAAVTQAQEETKQKGRS